MLAVDEASGALIGAVASHASIGGPPISDVRDGLRSLFEKYGLPKALRVDNGGPWGRLQKNTPKWLALWIRVRAWTFDGFVQVRQRTTRRLNDAIGLLTNGVNPTPVNQSRSGKPGWIRWSNCNGKNILFATDSLRRPIPTPEFKEVKRPYSRETEMDSWDLSQAKRLLSQFSWQRVVSSKGQIAVNEPTVHGR